MTEYEILDLISTHRTEGGFHVMNFSAAMFGYVAAAYFVGDKLSRFQTYAVTFIFCLFLPGPMLAAYEAALAITFLSDTYGLQYESVQNTAKTLATVAPALVPSIIFFGWIVSVLFMWQIRRRKRTGVK